jgi:hypothetical protein
VPRVNENGRWYPPIRSNGFGQQVPSRIFRWSENGRISSADDCQWFNNQWWSSAGDQLTEYRASTLFWCNNFTQFMVATGDASARHMDESPDPQNRWWPLSFRHEGSLSRVEEVGQEARLAGSGNWINALGLSSYRNRHTTPIGGLAGNAAIVIGLIAFSCEARHLDDILLTDRAWRRGARWHGHHRNEGRTLCIRILFSYFLMLAAANIGHSSGIEGRGVVVTIYLDPSNPQGSMVDTIYPLEWSGGPLLQ